MALSMEERRILTQIEVHLSEDDPRLAHRFNRLGGQRRRRRIRLIAAIAIAVVGVLTATAAGIFIVVST